MLNYIYIFLSVFTLLLLAGCGGNDLYQPGEEEPVTNQSQIDLDKVVENTINERRTNSNEDTTSERRTDSNEDTSRNRTTDRNTVINQNISQLLHSNECTFCLLIGADLKEANLSDANLSNANLRDANLSDANLSDANLSNANLRDANLSDANLSDANLSGAKLPKTFMLRANLTGANLKGAYLRETDLTEADLTGADLTGASLYEAVLTGVIGADLPTPITNLVKQSVKQWTEPPAMTIDNTATYVATIRTNMGNVTIELFASEAPETVNSFNFLANEGFYDGVIFHRVIPSFMIQSGDPEGIGSGGAGYSFNDEFDSDLIFDRAGILAMANSGPNTNSSQFFITTVPTPHLNGTHAIFGQVIKGQDVVDAISMVATIEDNRPKESVVILGVDITQ